MKKSILITFILLLVGVVGANAQKTFDTYEIQVDGLGCPFCAYGLEKKFKEFKGIKKVAIEIETGDFSFQYPSEKALSMEEVEKQVEKAGYTPISSKITRANGEIETSDGNDMAALDMENMTTGSVFVAGKCGMCRARIVKAATSVSGVGKADWDQDSKILEVTYDPSATSLKDIQAQVAMAGHDTKGAKATAAAYKNLPGCCKYERLDQ